MTRFRNTTNICFALCLAIGLQFVLPVSASQALTITNCTGSSLAIKVGSQKQANRILHSATALPGTTNTVDTREPFVTVRLFEHGIIQTLRVSVPSIVADAKYSAIRLTNGQWQLVTGHVC